MWNLIRPLLFKMDAESAHQWSLTRLEKPWATPRQVGVR